MSEDLLPLSEVVRGLREEIVAAMQTATNEAVRFKLGAIDLEFTAVAIREGGANGKISFKVFGMGADLGADGKYSKEKTQKIALSLTPLEILPDGTTKEIEIRKVPKVS